MGKPPCRDGSTPPLRPLPSLPSLRSLPAPTHTLRQRGRRGQLLAVGANAMGLAQSVGLLLSTDRLVKGAAGSGGALPARLSRLTFPEWRYIGPGSLGNDGLKMVRPSIQGFPLLVLIGVLIVGADQLGR